MISLKEIAIKSLPNEVIREQVFLDNQGLLDCFNIKYVGKYFPRITSAKYDHNLPMSYIITSKKDYLVFFEGPYNNCLVNAFTATNEDKHLKGCVFQIRGSQVIQILDDNKAISDSYFKNKDNCFIFDISNDRDIPLSFHLKDNFYICFPSKVFQTLMDAFSYYYWKTDLSYQCLVDTRSEIEITFSMKIAYLRDDFFEEIRNKNHTHVIEGNAFEIYPAENVIKSRKIKEKNYLLLILVVFCNLIVFGSGISLFTCAIYYVKSIHYLIYTFLLVSGVFLSFSSVIIYFRFLIPHFIEN